MADIKINSNDSSIKTLLRTKSALVSRVVFFLFALFFLGVYYQDFLYQIGWKDYFLGNEAFRGMVVTQTAGWLIYLSRYITQLFVCPKTAALVIALLLSAIEWLTAKVSCRNDQCYGLSFLPSALLLLIIGISGMAVYGHLEIGTFVALILGTLWTLLCLLVYRKWQSYTIGLLLILQVLMLPVMGAFSVVTLLAIAVDRLKKKDFVPLLFTIVVAPVTLYLVGRHLFEENALHSFVAPLPHPSFIGMFVCSLCLVVSLLFVPLMDKVRLPRMIKQEEMAKYAIVLVLLCFTFFLSYRDSRFRTLVQLSRLTDEMEWKKVSEIASQVKNPTKGINSFRVIAENAMGRLNQKVFDVKLPFSNLKSDYAVEQSVYVTDLFFNASMFSMAYQFDMDAWVEFGESFRSLKHMALISLMRGEDELAERYIGLMRQTPVLRSLADEYATYVGHQDRLFAKYPLYETLKKMEILENIPQIYTSNVSSMYLTFHQFDANTMERRLLADLYEKNIDVALNEFQYFRRIGWKAPVPKWFHEALVIKGIMMNDMRIAQQSNVDPVLINKVVSCFNDFKKYRKDQMKEAAETMYQKYKGMYAYYYLFNNYMFN